MTNFDARETWHKYRRRVTPLSHWLGESIQQACYCSVQTTLQKGAIFFQFWGISCPNENFVPTVVWASASCRSCPAPSNNATEKFYAVCNGVKALVCSRGRGALEHMKPKSRLLLKDELNVTNICLKCSISTAFLHKNEKNIFCKRVFFLLKKLWTPKSCTIPSTKSEW